MVENKPGTGIDEDPPLVYVEAVVTSAQAPQKPKEEWSCPQCTLLNPARKLYCIACFQRHPDLAPSNVGPSAPSEAFDNDIDDNDDDDNQDDDGEYEYEYYDQNRENEVPNDNNERHVVERDIVTRPSNDGCASLQQNIITLHAEEDPFHKKIRRRIRRKKRMAAGGAAGAAAGIIFGGPALVVAGAAVGCAVGARVVSKHREKLKDERVAMQRYVIETKGQARVSE
mmetsp:Transcript_6081/g.14731  ORF Transcript_6081/g.14731 Transcript_6081/m.14731 type:complete len:227 (+) Transcript_6081:109-789(+)